MKNINEIALAELERALDKCGSDEKFSIDLVVPGKPLVLWEFNLDLLRDLVAHYKATSEDVLSPQELWTGGYEAGWEECAEDIVPICSPSRAERAWNRLRKP
jgi:hypothetical protein